VRFSSIPDSATATGAQFPDLARRLFGSVTLRFHDDGALFSDIASVSLGPCRLSRIDASAHCVDGARVVRRSFDPDAIKLILQADGCSVFEQGGVNHRLGPGAMILYDPTQPYSLDNRSPISQVLLQLPRHHLPARALAALRLHSFVKAEAEGEPRIVGALMLSAMREAPALDGRASKRIGDALIRLATAFVTTASEMQEEGGEPVSLTVLAGRAHAYIESHLDQPDLDVDEVARRMGCSRRYIFRAFERKGTTPAVLLWSLRLDRACERLGDPAFRSSSITEIAFSCGFSSTAHFSRAFRKRFGCAPRDARSAPRATSSS
jgi:AraC-like DNA-binding protein